MVGASYLVFLHEFKPCHFLHFDDKAPYNGSHIMDNCTTPTWEQDSEFDRDLIDTFTVRFMMYIQIYSGIHAGTTLDPRATGPWRFLSGTTIAQTRSLSI